MTAQEQMKKILDELMGTSRDGERPVDDIKFSDHNVCKSYLMGLCPHELFNNTKMDIGDCNKVHSAALKADYEAASKQRSYGYDIDQMKHLQAFIKECDHKIVLAKKRLAETQDDFSKTTEAQAVHELGEKIGKKLAEAEALGAEGKVDESLTAMAEVEELKTQKRMAEDIYHETLPSSSVQQQKLRVCEVCAAYLSLYDNDRRLLSQVKCCHAECQPLPSTTWLPRENGGYEVDTTPVTNGKRLADHFGGKLHMGFIKIRDRLKELEEQVAKKREEREKERAKRREEREKEVEERRKARDRERNGDRDRRRDRSRDRDQNRDYDRRDRDYDRRDRDYDRRDRDYDRRDRDYDRKDRYRDKSRRDRRRSRSRDRDRRRSRSRSRDRRRSRSRSRDRRRRQSRSRSDSRRPSRSRSKSAENPQESLEKPRELPEGEKEVE